MFLEKFPYRVKFYTKYRGSLEPLCGPKGFTGWWMALRSMSINAAKGGMGLLRPFFIKSAAKPPPPPSEPSHRRCVQWRNRIRGEPRSG